MMSSFSFTRAVVRTARPAKILPLLAIPALGAAFARTQIDLPALMVLCVLAFVSSVWVTQINVVTDVDLDATARPELARDWRGMGGASGRLLRLAPLAWMAGVAALVVMGKPLVGLALSGAVAFAVLYSYNFLSRRPVETRLKTSWLGHAASLWSGYFFLYLAGTLCAVGGRDFSRFALCAAAATSDYAFYLAESAVDVREEREAGLRTLPVILGPMAATLVSLAVGAMALGVAGLRFDWALVVALAPAMALRLSTQGMFAWAWAAKTEARPPRLLWWVPDLVFVSTRAWVLSALIFLDSAAP